MNKLDEIKQEIKRIYLTEPNVLTKYLDVIDKLAPYVELADIFTNCINENDIALENTIYCLDENDEKRVIEIYKQIKEMEK